MRFHIILEPDRRPSSPLAERFGATLILLLAVGVLVSAALGGTVRRSPLEQLASPHGFDLTRWELRHLPGKWLHLAGRWLRGEPPREVRRQETRRYFQLAVEIDQLRGRLNQLLTESDERAQIEEMIDRRLRGQRRLAPVVEASVEGELTALLEGMGLAEEVPLFGVPIVWPPVDFVVEETPRVLVTSPRDDIAVADSILVRPGLTLHQAERLEAAADALENTSSIVVTTGGIAFYPAVIRPNSAYGDSLETLAHEWVHQWLYFHPLGRRYFSGGELAIINETVANIAGRELGDLLARRLGIEVPAATPGLPAAAAPPPGRTISFRAEMHDLRLEVDRLLAGGRIREAEALMEERRGYFARSGIYIRKINQAYFAFYGTYADTPASSSPLGPKIETIRGRSPDLASFLRRMAGVRSPADVDRILGGS